MPMTESYRRRPHLRAGIAPTLVLLLAGCAPALPPSAPTLSAPQAAFFSGLQRLCGSSFAGRVVEAPPADTTFSGHPLRMQVRECSDAEVVIGVEVGDDRSRSWIVRRSGEGLRLTHVHLEADGSEAANSRYGGATREAGTARRQDFPADSFSIRMLPARATQAWTLELEPGVRLDYSLHRAATGLRYRFRFDLVPID
jgi:hypothetical protein